MAENRETGGINLEYEELEALAQEDYADFVVLLQEAVDDQTDGEAFIDLSLEMQNPDIISYTNKLTQIIAGERSDEAARLAGYRAFHFAYSVGSLLLSSQLAVSFPDYRRSGLDDETLHLVLANSVSGYFSGRPGLDALTGRFMPELDPSGRHGNVAELVAGSTFLHIEASEQQRAIEQEVAAFEVDLSRFEGMEP